jgi:hypothetical protein
MVDGPADEIEISGAHAPVEYSNIKKAADELMLYPATKHRAGPPC